MIVRCCDGSGPLDGAGGGLEPGWAGGGCDGAFFCSTSGAAGMPITVLALLEGAGAADGAGAAGGGGSDPEVGVGSPIIVRVPW